MKKCTYCGKEHPDDSTRCSIDGSVLEWLGPAPPVIIEALTNPQPAQVSTSLIEADNIPGDRRLRIIEIVLMCVIAFGGSALLSIYSLFGETQASSLGAVRWPYGMLHEGAVLGLLWYVLLRRSKSMADIGFGWKWTDIGWSILLWFGGSIAFSMTYRIIYYSGLTSTSGHESIDRVTHYLFGSGVVVMTLVFQLINPFFEELIVRAYLMTEVRQVTNSVAKAVIISTAVQMSYHLYQGVPMTIADGALFFVWSLYFAKTNRITPIILAHLYADVSSTLLYVFHDRATSLGAS